MLYSHLRNLLIMNWKIILYCLLPGAVYISVSELLPEWNHALAGLFAGLVWVAVFFLLPKKLDEWKRVVISAAAVTVVAGIIRFIPFH